VITDPVPCFVVDSLSSYFFFSELLCSCKCFVPNSNINERKRGGEFCLHYVALNNKIGDWCRQFSLETTSIGGLVSYPFCGLLFPILLFFLESIILKDSRLMLAVE
jgi:hypothetical protein